MKKKKILFSLEDFENHFSKEFIKRLKINYDITIITSTKNHFSLIIVSILLTIILAFR